MTSTFLHSQPGKVRRWATCPLPPSAAYTLTSERRFEADTWVKLLAVPSPYSYDEALLLTESSAQEWLVWIPDHGEAILNTSQFV